MHPDRTGADCDRQLRCLYRPASLPDEGVMQKPPSSCAGSRSVSWSQLAAEGHAGSPGRTRGTGGLTVVPSTEAAENTGNARLGNKAADAADLIRRRRFIDRLSCAEGFVLDVIGISAGMKITLPDKR